MDRKILHVDCNKFYASVECQRRPELRDKPVAVGGSEEARHGIILTKNEIAARYGIATGDTLYTARKKCPELVVVPPDFATYSRFSRMVREILRDYTDLIEPFGLDEAWVQLPSSADEVATAHAIRRRVKEELGITVSVGVSFNKTFAKLGSDYKKPDAVTVFSRENFKELVWPLAAEELIFVGRSTVRQLHQRYLFTIGDVAGADPAMLRAMFGKWGPMLHAMANGEDHQPLIPMGTEPEAQSVSHGLTTPRDLTDDRDVRLIMTLLGESVGRRLREQHLMGKIIEVHLRDNTLHTVTYRVTLEHYLQTTDDIVGEAFALFHSRYDWAKPLRSVTVGICGLVPEDTPVQLDFTDSAAREKRGKLDRAVDGINARFGHACVRRAVILEDPALCGIAPDDQPAPFSAAARQGSSKP